VGAGFTGQARGGGSVVENGSALNGQYFYVDFAKKRRDFPFQYFSHEISQNTWRSGQPDRRQNGACVNPV